MPPGTKRVTSKQGNLSEIPTDAVFHNTTHTPSTTACPIPNRRYFGGLLRMRVQQSRN